MNIHHFWFHREICSLFEPWYYIPYWSLIYAVTCCIHFSTFISFSILYLFLCVRFFFSLHYWLIQRLLLHDDLNETERDLFESKQHIVYLKVLVNAMSYHHSHPILVQRRTALKNWAARHSAFLYMMKLKIPFKHIIHCNCCSKTVFVWNPQCGH